MIKVLDNVASFAVMREISKSNDPQQSTIFGSRVTEWHIFIAILPIQMSGYVVMKYSGVCGC